VSRGHSFERIWYGYTPRMIFAFHAAARQNRRHELAEDLIATAIGAQGNQESIDNQLGEWIE
jgi:hypothetical protein